MAFRENTSLQPLHGQEIPRNLLLYDTETYINATSPGVYSLPLRLGVAIYVEIDNELRGMKRKVYRFKTATEFLDILKNHNRKKTKLYILAHNQGFDIRVLNLPKLFHDEGWSSTLPILNNRTFIWKIKTDKGVLHFLDTANFGVISVDQLGRDMNLEKLSVDFNTDDEELLFTYCQRDCEILEKFMLEYLRFIRSNQLGSFKVTIASQALTTYRTRFLSEPPILHNFWHVCDLERDAYHGGRTEAFYLGHLPEEDYYYLDVNSMYPYVMRDTLLPVKLEGYTEDVSPAFMPLRLKKYYVIADCELETDRPFAGVINNHKLIFPVGRFRAVLHQAELEYLLQHGKINHVYRCAVYAKGQPFTDYVNFFYDIKKQAELDHNTSWRYITKLFLNSLYGKFGQLRPRRELMGRVDYEGIWRHENINIDTGETWIEVCWFGEIFKDYKKGETSFSFPALAGAVTANARMQLWRYIELAELKNTFYTDTDSLIVNKSGYENLTRFIDNHALGYLKLEKISTTVDIWGCKDYHFGEIERKKGVPAKAKKLTTNSWQYQQFEGFLTWMNNGADTAPQIFDRIKTRKSVYDKGNCDNLPRITPHVFPLTSVLPQMK